MSENKSANDHQVGGEHYKSNYQHWDFVSETGMNYLLANATKYISRFHKKNGIQDLKKAMHYVDKAIEVFKKESLERYEKAEKFAATLPSPMQQALIRCSVRVSDPNISLLLVMKRDLDQLLFVLDKPHEDNTGQEHPFGFDKENDTSK